MLVTALKWLCQHYNNINKVSSKNKHTNLYTHVQQPESTAGDSVSSQLCSQMLPALAVTWWDAHPSNLQCCPGVCSLSLWRSCCLWCANRGKGVNSFHSSVWYEMFANFGYYMCSFWFVREKPHLWDGAAVRCQIEAAYAVKVPRLGRWY